MEPAAPARFDMELPEDAIIVEDFNEFDFIDYYYHDGNFWHFNGEAYRILHINTAARDGGRCVFMRDVEGINHLISLAAYRRYIGEIA